MQHLSDNTKDEIPFSTMHTWQPIIILFDLTSFSHYMHADVLCNSFIFHDFFKNIYLRKAFAPPLVF